MKKNGSEARVPSKDPLIGKTVGKYEIVRMVGQGGMGQVYEAVHTTLGKRVAMKFIDHASASSKDAVARFQREAQAASAVESAHIVEIFDSGESIDGRPYLVMELLRGEDLGNRIKRCGRLELAEALHITAQLLRGLFRAHEAGIIHRDLKPDNVFLVDRDDDDNFAKILDFGISKMQKRGGTPTKTITREGTVLGTPFYMSPEQAQATDELDGRTDLWSVGAILYECLCGRPPFSGASYEQVIVNICTKDAADIRVHNPAVPENVAAALKRALAREREDRFESALAFLDSLVTASEGIISIRPMSGSGAGSDTPRPVRAQRASGDRALLTEESAPTVDVGVAGTSKIGWSTSRTPGRRDRRIFAVVAVVSVALGIVAALLYMNDGDTAVAQLPPAAPADTDVDVQLKCDANGASFRLGDVELAGGRISGPEGSTQTITVSAPGFKPKQLQITFNANQPAIDVRLDPEDAPPPVTSASAEVEVVATAMTTKPPALKPKIPPPVAPTTLPSPPTGVAGDLQLKTD